MKITFFSGVGEIGGNKILVEEGDTHVFLDFGKSYHQASLYFEEFLNPRAVQGIKDYLELDLLPSLEGLYRKDLLEILNEEGVSDLRYTTPYVNGVLLSHAHLDHCAYISFLDEQIPVYMNATTHKVLKSLSIIRPNTLENEILETNIPHKASFKKRHKLRRKIKIIEDGKTFSCGNLLITPLLVDHSIPGATMYFIQGKKKNVLYSGDFRLSEIPQRKLRRIYQFLSKNHIDVFLCEGTRITEKKIVREQDVYKQAKSIISKVKNLVVADYSLTDVERFQTLATIAKENKRIIALPFNYFGYLVYLAKQGYPIKQLSQAKLYLKKKTNLKKWEKELAKKYPSVDDKTIHKNQRHYLVILNFYQIQELIDLQPSRDSYFLRAITEPHNEEMAISEERFAHWIEHFKMKGVRKIKKEGKEVYEFTRTHISGHISGAELKQFLDKIKPEVVIPIHTEHPEAFKEIYNKKIKIVAKNETIKI